MSRSRSSRGRGWAAATRGGVLVLTFGALAGAPSRAQAQSVSGFAVDRFEPAGGGSEWFSLESLDFRGHLRPAAGLVADWAWKPLVIFDQGGGEVASLIRHQVIGHAGAAMVLWDRARLDVSLPVALVQRGSGGQVNGQSYAPPPTGAGIGDLRLGIDVRLFGRAHQAVTAAVGVQLFPATGRTDAFTSDGGLRVWPRLMLAGDVGPLAWAVRAGYHARPKNKCNCDLAPGDEVTAALAAGLRVTPSVLIGPELYASSARSDLGKPVATPLELLLGAHLAVARDWTVGAGLAPGLTDGAGSPRLRVVVGVQYFPALAEAAAPPAAPAPAPVAVRPKPRPIPAPPAPPPPPPPPPPPDQDQDGIVDPEDACPKEAGERSADPQKNGCPAPKDRDQDGIVDPEDACPDAAGPRNDDPAKSGCPVVRIEGGQIRIREQVKFKTASATILKESDYILEAVVKVLAQQSEIRKVRVEGHTDTRGKPRYNKKLSQRRAASVVKWLVKHGIDRRRLSSEGYGQERPLATNQTEDGRRENRRVEFHIVEGPGAEQ